MQKTFSNIRSSEPILATTLTPIICWAKTLTPILIRLSASVGCQSEEVFAQPYCSHTIRAYPFRLLAKVGSTINPYIACWDGEHYCSLYCLSRCWALLFFSLLAKEGPTEPHNTCIRVGTLPHLQRWRALSLVISRVPESRNACRALEKYSFLCLFV